MALTKEEIEKIATEIGSQVAGQKCNCMDIDPFWIDAAAHAIDMLPRGQDRDEAMTRFVRVTKQCGFERTEQGWDRYTKQSKALDYFGRIDRDWQVVKEHDDGDLTIRTTDGVLHVVTTDGQKFNQLVD